MIESFSQLLQPLSVSEFIERYWDRDFVHSHGEQDRYELLFPWSVLNEALILHRHSPTRLKLAKGGTLIDPWTFLVKEVRPGRVRLDVLLNYLRDGATLILNCVEELYPPLAVVTKSLEETIGIGVNANLYAGWREEHGFDVHFDIQENLICQLQGEKRWRVWRPTRISPLKPDIEEPPRPTGSPFWDGELTAGSFIYVPRGWWHVAQPMGAPCLHLTFTINSRTGFDFLTWALNRSRQSSIIRRTLPLSQNGLATGEYLVGLKAALDDYLTPDALTDFLRSLPRAPSSTLTLPNIWDAAHKPEG